MGVDLYMNAQAYFPCKGKLGGIVAELDWLYVMSYQIANASTKQFVQKAGKKQDNRDVNRSEHTRAHAGLLVLKNSRCTTFVCMKGRSQFWWFQHCHAGAVGGNLCCAVAV